MYTRVDRMLMASPASFFQAAPLPEAKILREATQIERARLQAGTSHVGWHVHGTHVFAIPVIETKTGADAEGDAQKMAPGANTMQDCKPQMEYGPSTPPQPSDDQGASPASQHFMYVYLPTQRSSSTWWSSSTTRDWSSGCSNVQDNCRQTEWLDRCCSCGGRGNCRCCGSDDALQQYDVLRRLINQTRSVLARWDHHSQEYKALHDRNHVYDAPPPMHRVSRNGALPVADLARMSVPQGDWGTMVDGRSAMRPYYARQSSADNMENTLTYCAWVFLILLLVVLFVGTAAWGWGGRQYGWGWDRWDDDMDGGHHVHLPHT
jgi:hypothetical protein